MYTAAGVKASRMLKNDNVKNAIGQILELQNMGLEVRLKDIGNGVQRATDTVTQTYYKIGENGKETVTSKTVTEKPNKEKAEYHELLNRMTEIYDRNKATATVYGRELTALIKRGKGNSKKREGGWGQGPASREEDTSSHIRNKKTKGGAQ